MALSESDSGSEETVECPTCEQEVSKKYMSGRECLSCEHARDDAREAQRAVERGVMP